MLLSFLRFWLHRTGKNGRRIRAEILAAMPAHEGRWPKPAAKKKDGVRRYEG